jgi:glycosyltransferase involved in cell wall biosynthesis
VRYLRAERPAALLSPFEVTSAIAIVAKRISGAATRIVVRVSVNLSQNKRVRWKKILERVVISILYPVADGIVTVSQGVADDLSTYSLLPLHDVRVIYNPVVSDRLSRLMEEPVEHPFLMDLSYPVVLGVGRFVEQKDFPTLIKAFNIVRETIPSRLIILGDGNDRDVLESLIGSLGLNDCVDLPGFTLNPFSFMKRASVFVLSSKWEGLPGTLIQALACGCPVVSTNCLSGPSEILKGGEYGHLVSVGDIQAMATGIEAVLKGDFREPPEGWLDQFTLSTVIPQYESILGL